MLDYIQWGTGGSNVFEPENDKIPEGFSGQPRAAVKMEHCAQSRGASLPQERGAVFNFPKGTLWAS